MQEIKIVDFDVKNISIATADVLSWVVDVAVIAASSMTCLTLYG